jgi:hypothetical protein
MNDYWNDEPQGDEPPECCGDFMDVDGRVFVCPQCGRRVEFPADPEPPEDYSEPDWQNHYAIPLSKCRHGRDPHNCDACDHEGDLAYDASRESK